MKINQLPKPKPEGNKVEITLHKDMMPFSGITAEYLETLKEKEADSSLIKSEGENTITWTGQVDEKLLIYLFSIGVSKMWDSETETYEMGIRTPSVVGASW